MGDDSSLTNHFLIAMPALADPNFSQTVTYICEHNDDGALGIVINRPSDLSLDDLFRHMVIEPRTIEMNAQPVYMGGPVQRERGFVLHTPAGDWNATLRIAGELAITTSRDILEALALGDGPERYLVALGYAGWARGQLEQEMADNAWLSGPADPSVIFERDHQERWRAAAAGLGVDLTLLSSDTGHA